MRIAVSSQGPSLDSPFEPRFARCAYFVVVDTDTMEFQSYPNPGQNATGGAATQAVQLISGLGVSAVITGSFGPNAASLMASTGIKGYRGQGGTVRDVVLMFKEGRLPPLATDGQGGMPPQGGGFGGGMGQGGGFGRGGGRGMGRGGGYGRGGGRGMGRGGGFGRGGW